MIKEVHTVLSNALEPLISIQNFSLLTPHPLSHPYYAKQASNKLGAMLIANIKIALAEEEALELEQKLKEDRERLARKKAQVCPLLIVFFSTECFFVYNPIPFVISIFLTITNHQPYMLIHTFILIY